MSAVDRCACPSAYGICDGPQPDCSEHGTADEILASGRCTDRRGREWHYDTKHRFWLATPGFIAGWKVTDFGGPLDEPQMRLLIERDQHRDVCPGLYNCMNHPVPIVWYGGISEGWCVDLGNWHSSLSDAMDAARALAVEP